MGCAPTGFFSEEYERKVESITVGSSATTTTTITNRESDTFIFTDCCGNQKKLKGKRDKAGKPYLEDPMCFTISGPNKLY